MTDIYLHGILNTCVHNLMNSLHSCSAFRNTAREAAAANKAESLTSVKPTVTVCLTLGLFAARESTKKFRVMSNILPE